MNILYVSPVPSTQEFHRMRSVEKPDVLSVVYGMNEAGFRFHTMLIEGLARNSENQVYSLVGRSVSSKIHKGLLWKTRREQVCENVEVKHIGLVNLPVIKQIGVALSMFFSTLRWLVFNKNDDKGIILDASYVTVLPFVVAATKIIPCKKAAIFCDVYDYMGEVDDANTQGKVSLLRRALRKFVGYGYRNLESMVLLTEAMNEVVNKRNVPYFVMEGLVDKDRMLAKRERGTRRVKHIMYAGALRKQYGAENLVKGFMGYHDADARLLVLGDGDYADHVREAAALDGRIKFLGRMPQESVLRLEQRVSLLINPRPADSEFTKYSFPSKNLEYMSSGTPLLTTKLPGMPHEYYDYVYLIDGEGSRPITAALEHVLSDQSEDDRLRKGRMAYDFVISEKNNVAQAQRICALLEKGL